MRRNCDGSRRDLDRAEGMRRRSWSPMTLMELDAKDVRPEASEERRKHLARLLSRIDKAMRQGIQLSEAITGDGPPSFAMPAVWALKALSRSGSAPGMSAAVRGHG